MSAAVRAKQALESLKRNLDACCDLIEDAINKGNHRIVQKHLGKLNNACEDLEEKVCDWASLVDDASVDSLECLAKLKSRIWSCENRAGGYLETATNDKAAKESRKVENNLVTLEDRLRSLCKVADEFMSSEHTQRSNANCVDEMIKARDKDMIDLRSNYEKILYTKDCEQLRKRFLDLERWYVSWQAKAKQFVGQFGTLSPSVNLTDHLANDGAMSMKLAKVKYPVFQGERREYARFKIDFKETVEKHLKLPFDRVYTLLNECLAGDARQLVAGLRDYDKIWAKLEKRYGDTAILVTEVLNDVGKLPVLSDSDSRGFIK